MKITIHTATNSNSESLFFIRNLRFSVTRTSKAHNFEKSSKTSFSNISTFGTEPSFGANLLLREPPSRGLLYIWLHQSSNRLRQRSILLRQRSIWLRRRSHLDLKACSTPAAALLPLPQEPQEAPAALLDAATVANVFYKLPN